jgi:hypothetical protein
MTRDTKAVTRSDIGKNSNADAGDPAKVRDLLATLVPVEAIAAYSVLLAVVLEYIDGQRKEGDDPGSFELLRWGLVAVLLVATAYLVYMTWMKKKQPAADRKAPVVEIIAACLAAAAWSLSGPGTPVALRFEGLGAVFVPVAILFVVFIALIPVIPKLREQAT